MDTDSFINWTFEEKLGYFRSPGRFKTPDDRIKGYDMWSNDPGYDKEYCSAGYNGPLFLATTVHKYLSDKKDAKILDVGAGTGMAGEKLTDLGYTNIDCLDPSKGMLDVARSKNIYGNYLCALFTNHVDGINTGAYDALVSSGCLAEGHLKCEHLPEMIRCVKPGGIIVLVGREIDMYTLDEWKDRLEPLIKWLEEDGQWTLLERTVTPDYYPNVNGITMAFRVAK